MPFPDHRLRHALVPFVLAFAGAATVAVDARASEPMSVYAVPSKVELIPDEVNPTRVIIRGSFFFLQSTTVMAYSEPTCGTMYFECKPGESMLCRMQWNEIRAQIGSSWCVGFGQKNAISTAMVRPAGAAMGSPFLWDIGMGISPGTYVDGKCSKARAAQCGGTFDGGVSPPLADSGVGGSSSGGTTGSAKGGTAGSTPGTGGSGGTTPTTGTSTAGRMDAGPELENGGSGCSLAGNELSDDGWLYALFGMGCLATRRRRARRS
jgi:hypothetical protein